MDAILFSANPTMVKVDDAIRHLADHEELYWEFGFSINRDRFLYPILGYIHICGGQVEYVAKIKDIIPFSPSHYEDKELSMRVKPRPWLREWDENFNNCRLYPWKNAFVMAHIEPFSHNTYDFQKYGGDPVKKPPQNYIRVLQPGQPKETLIRTTLNSRSVQKASLAPINQRRPLAERNLEDFVLLQLDEIEPGLKLIKRQLSTAAGRLDILCQDRLGWYVVVELKRDQGTDQVVGQILRYIGWVQENYSTDKVRGIIIVGKKDNIMSYAVKAVSNIQVKEFRLTIE
jgi:hypothetical protein